MSAKRSSSKSSKRSSKKSSKAKPKLAKFELIDDSEIPLHRQLRAGSDEFTEATMRWKKFGGEAHWTAELTSDLREKAIANSSHVLRQLHKQIDVEPSEQSLKKYFDGVSVDNLTKEGEQMIAIPMKILKAIRKNFKFQSTLFNIKAVQMMAIQKQTKIINLSFSQKECEHLIQYQMMPALEEAVEISVCADALEYCIKKAANLSIKKESRKKSSITDKIENILQIKSWNITDKIEFDHDTVNLISDIIEKEKDLQV